MPYDIHPKGALDYPRTFQEFDARFSSEEACYSFLRELRWGAGFQCPRCLAHAEPWTLGGGLLKCRWCKHRTSLTAGTILEGTRKSVRTWFLVMWFVTSQKLGASALGLQRVLGFGSYETAWTWLHKLRRAMVRPDRDQLSGEIEVDETFVGGVERGGGRRHIGKKALVAIAAEVRGDGIGRIRLKRIADSSAASLLPFVQSVAAINSTVITDGLPSYMGLTDAGYNHRSKVIKASGRNADSLLPRVHRVAALLKRWILGTHQGAVSRDHLDYYLDEFTFRFNRRASKARGLLFYRLAQQAVHTRPAPYRSLTAPRNSEG